MTSNESRTALVTGGTSGIGLAIAQRLQADGLKVAVLDLDRPQAREVAQEQGFTFIAADLSRREDCRRAVDETVAALGGLDVLVNNAGFQHIDPIADFPEDTWDTMLHVMLTAPFLLLKYAWPHLTRSGQGRVVNIASIHGQVASPFKSAYISAKHGLIGLTRTAALEAGEQGFTVNAICPGYVRTPLVEGQIADQARTRGLSEQEVEQKVMLEPAAIKKLLDPQDIAALASYVISPAAWGMTGAVLDIDLGWTAR
ncbi:3-hydroxybutyrate dehydrogenase [Deinococcus metallilatus]|uniref:3-hydroxybutyrate dehydrogenase n=1 Tax=Deinococcus metallilatus TaxID=1211322 RepID=A0AAJ5F0V2_9DEIO|nr:3-hydroxybutyrate dehydrogenase [Deinococcus metallilatus]MBB5294308.1 3-hydroxybutyrate dehydrogenase [Deinococcus metallilatus]QBY09080.1 3-hydroxybutyrate dehydrogenase [Deinococcus metallilatus]RXJ10224.1 3-hydroxybutyrate dehydrogenase [Deinococcus metallilatus]TLK22516.1 3-hydroxybutyrate dehydrogenase [Deinococcus metallilatus]